MSETIQVPLEIQPPQDRPAWANRSLHRVKMGASLAAAQTPAVEHEAYWQQSKYNPERGEFRHRPIESQPKLSNVSSPPAALVQEISELREMVKNMAENQYGSQQYGGQYDQEYDPQHSIPDDIDIFDQQALGAFIQKTIAETISPHQQTLRDARVVSEYGLVKEAHGDDPQFQFKMRTALEMCGAEPGLSIADAYRRVDDPQQSRPGQRGAGAGHLPESLSKSKFPRFGQILLHNQRTGRSGR